MRTDYAIIILGLMSATLHSQGQAQQLPNASAVVYPGQAERHQTTLVSIGIRRGIREVEEVRYGHPVDLTNEINAPIEVQDALEELDGLAELLELGEPQEAQERSDQIIALFETNLATVPRRNLVDVFMISALARCAQGAREDCETRLRQVITFRESLRYDSDRYPEAFQEVFQRVRARTRAGRRGTLIVETNPPGAEVFVDGRSYGPSPATAEGLLVGTHYITVKELGFQKSIVQAEVLANQDRDVFVELSDSMRARLIVATSAQGAVRGELGAPQAGPHILSLRETLGVRQVVLATIRPVNTRQLQVQLYLYHLFTRLLQNEQETVITADADGIIAVEALVQNLFDGIDPAGAIAAPEELYAQERPVEIYEEWWFWATIVGGAALVAGAVALGASVGGSSVPDGWTRISGTIP